MSDKENYVSFLEEQNKLLFISLKCVLEHDNIDICKSLIDKFKFNRDNKKSLNIYDPKGLKQKKTC